MHQLPCKVQNAAIATHAKRPNPVAGHAGHRRRLPACTKRGCSPQSSHNYRALCRELDFAETSSSIIYNVRVRSGVMVRGFVVFILTVMLAIHAATPSRACTTDGSRVVSADFPDPGNLQASNLAEAGGVAGNQIDPHHHTAPCQDHCNWFASISFQGFLPPERGADIELSRQMLPVLLAVAVPPPK